MSPYIVTTERELPSAEDSSTLLYREHRVVATLEEARAYLTDGTYLEWDTESLASLHDLVKSMSGGTVGPLPDGTTVVVKPWPEQAARAWAHFYGGLDRDAPIELIVDALSNARQS